MKDSKDKDKKADLGASKKAYEFGTIEKIVLQPHELETSVFALMHGVDGCDPRIGTMCSIQ